MPTGAKRFAYSVILAGGPIFAVAAWNWTSPNLYRFVIYFALALIVSMLKFRLPGIEGTFSPSFFFTLIGIIGFTLPETLVASCAGALVQCLWKPKQRPTITQILFSMANLCLSIALCFLLVRSASKFGFGYRPAVIALVAAVHFFTSTMLVSGVLSLFQGKPLRHVCQQWYLWSFPYYLLGATVVGLFPFSGRLPPAEG